MLHLFLGTSGTGKTTLLYHHIQQWVERGGRAILLVPEQASFESEKVLCRKLGAKNALSVEVLSFTRLCDRIFRELGGLAGIHMNETAKYLVMSAALDELGGELRAYGKNSGSAAFIGAMCETVSELTTAGAAPDSLRRAALESRDRDFSDKLEDIALIFEVYQAMIDRGYSDPDDSLMRAVKRLGDTDFFAGYGVFIDGFMAFMGAEWQLIGKILEKSPEVFAALTCSGLADRSDTGVFTAPARTANRMIETARQRGCRVAAPVILETPHRFRSPALARLAEEFPKLRPTSVSSTQDIQIIRCEDIYDELEYIASQIYLLLRDGYRYREIALIGRSMDRYLVPLQTVFGRYDIPFFADIRQDVQVHPIISGLLCALEAARTRFSSEPMLSLAKNCITGIDPIEAGALENYCFTWGITGSSWNQPFVNHPDGMEEDFTPEQSARLDRLNQTRERLVKPVDLLMRSLEGCDGKGFASAVFHYLESSGAAEYLQTYAQGMSSLEEKQFLDTAAQVWDAVVELLDVFGGVLSGLHQPLACMIDLFRMGTVQIDIGILPQTIDQVIVGSADRIRPNQPRAVFVIGLNEGEFPLWASAGGIFSASERGLLKEQGIDLLRIPEQQALFEKYYVYFALTQASEQLWLTYPQKNTAGAGLAPSSAVAQVEKILERPPVSSCQQDPLERACNVTTAFDLMAQSWQELSQRQAVLRNWFSEHSCEKLDSLIAASQGRTFRIQEPRLARRLFGEELRLSPSRVERYYNCPFSYFCESGLKLRARRRVEFDPIASGSLIHLVLEQMVRKYGGRGLAFRKDSELREEVAAMVQEHLSAKIQDFDGMPERFKYLFRRLVNTLVRLLKRLASEFVQSLFEPEAFEMPIRMDAQVKPLDLRTPDGTRVIVEGVVDRVDVYQRGDKRYVRVVDYKSGRKGFNLSDVCFGLNMQMLIYLFSICSDQEKGNAQSIPAGVLYLPARDQIVSVERNTPAEAVMTEQAKLLRMNGLLLEDRESLSAMEPNLAGVFIPVRSKKDGGYTSSSPLATLAQMGTIQRKIEQNLRDLANFLHEGRVEATPVDGLKDYTPCQWCDYHNICAHEDGDPVRRLGSFDLEAALELLKKEEETDV